MRRFLPLALLAALAAAAFSADFNAMQAKNAQMSFNVGDYVKAIEIYESIVEVEKVHNPYIYYNLSNAYYRNAQIGKAVLNIEKAFRLAPRDKDIKHNRDYLKALLGRQEKETVRESFFLLSALSLNELTVAAYILLTLFTLSFTAFLIIRKQVFKKTAIVLAVLTPIFAALLFLKLDYENENAVILKEAAVFDMPSSNESAFILPEGAFVKVLLENDGFALISAKLGAQKLKGWIESSQIGRL